MDCDVAMMAIKAYHVIWDNPEPCTKIFLHLGGFHLMQAFLVVGSYMPASGFEDIAFQSDHVKFNKRKTL